MEEPSFKTSRYYHNRSCVAVQIIQQLNPIKLLNAEFQVNLLKHLPKHDNLVEIRHAEKTANRIYIAYELYDYTLHDYVFNNTPKAQKEKKEIVLQMFAGLSHIHKNNYLHGQLNEHNVLLTLNDSMIVKLSNLSYKQEDGSVRDFVLHTIINNLIIHIFPRLLRISLH